VTRPIITPRQLLGRKALPPELSGCTVAVLGFCKFGAMVGKLSAEPLAEPIFSHAFPSGQFVARVAGRPVVAVERVYGGPLAATVLEELAHYGITHAIAYGYAGSLRGDLPIGRIVLAEAAFASDGAAREYRPDAALLFPDGALVQRLTECARAGPPLESVKVWTTDAIYREYPHKVAGWRDAGADVVNMDTGHLYAVSSVVGIAAVYACVISDCVEGPEWQDGFARVRPAMDDLENLVRATVEEIVSGAPAP
jgi:uridine phosphorylase